MTSMERDRLKHPHVLVMRTADGHVIADDAHEGQVMCLVFSARSKYFIAGTDDIHPTLTDLATGKRRTLMVPDGMLQTAAFSADDRLVALGAGTRTRVFKLSDLQTEIASLPDTISVTAAAFSPNSRLIATSTSNNHVRVWSFALPDLLREAKDRLQQIPDYLRDNAVMVKLDNALNLSRSTGG